MGAGVGTRFRVGDSVGNGVGAVGGLEGAAVGLVGFNVGA